MNANQLINMVIRLFMRNVMNRGINAGIKGVSRMTKAKPAKPKPRVDDEA